MLQRRNLEITIFGENVLLAEKLKLRYLEKIWNWRKYVHPLCFFCIYQM